MEDYTHACNDIEQFRTMVAMLRFYASASRVSYVDRLASAISIGVVEKTIAEALRELHALTSTAVMVNGRRCRYDEGVRGYVCDHEVSLRCCDYDLLDEYISAQKTEGVFTPVRPIPERMRLASAFVLVENMHPTVERLVGKVVACHICPSMPSSEEIEALVSCLKHGYWDILHRMVANALTREIKD